MLAPAAASACTNELIPAYFYPTPGGFWDEVTSTPTGGRTLIMNPASGPGRTADPAYATAVRRAQNAGMRVIGYVPTTYGSRPLRSVRADISAYRRWYGVDGIFVDEASSSTRALGYYRDVYRHIHAVAGQTAVLNPGTMPAEEYVTVSDVLVTFEGDVDAYRSAPAAGWTASHPRRHFANLVYRTPASAVDEVTALADARHAGAVYVTDDVLPNPWDTLPGYFSDVASRLATNCGSSLAARMLSPTRRTRSRVRRKGRARAIRRARGAKATRQTRSQVRRARR